MVMVLFCYDSRIIRIIIVVRDIIGVRQILG